MFGRVRPNLLGFSKLIILLIHPLSLFTDTQHWVTFHYNKSTHNVSAFVCQIQLFKSMFTSFKLL